MPRDQSTRSCVQISQPAVRVAALHAITTGVRTCGEKITSKVPPGRGENGMLEIEQRGEVRERKRAEMRGTIIKGVIRCENETQNLWTDPSNRKITVYERYRRPNGIQTREEG